MAGLEGKQLGDCEILAKLGQGGMGAVYKAKQTALDRMVAIKVLPAQFSTDDEFIARFKREAAAAARLTHPNIVQVYSSGKQEDTNYFVMEFVDGESVQQRLRRKGRIAPVEALAICVYVAQGLDYAWKRTKLIHRDIKPDNIFLSTDGEVKLGDLGLAKNAGGPQSGLTMTGAYMGTPYFVSPEQAQGLKEIDFRADIYSLGCTLYYMVSGHMPYESESCNALQLMFKHVNEPPPEILKVWPECPRPLAELITAMIQKQPDDRYQSYEELIADMKSVVAELRNGAQHHVAAAEAEKTQVAEPAPPKPPASVQKSPVIALILSGIAVISLLVLGLFLWAPWNPRSSAAPSASQTKADGLEPGAIKLWDAPDKIPNQPGVRWENAALVLGDAANAGFLSYSAPMSRDAIIRAEVRMVPDSRPQISLRVIPYQAQYCIHVDASAKLVHLGYINKGIGQDINLWPLPRVYSTNEWMRIELRAVGDELTVLADGQILGSAHDSRQLNAGSVSVFQKPKASGYFRNIVYVPLDKPGSTALSKTDTLEPGAIRLWASPDKIPNQPGVRWENSALVLGDDTHAGILRHSVPKSCDAIIRADVHMVSGSWPQIGLRMISEQPDYRIGVDCDQKLVKLCCVMNGIAQYINEWPLPRAYAADEWLRIELRAVGDKLTVLADGQILGIAHDSRQLKAGSAFVFQKPKASGYFRNIVYVPLDKPGSGSEASPSAALRHATN